MSSWWWVMGADFRASLKGQPLTEDLALVSHGIGNEWWGFWRQTTKIWTPRQCRALFLYPGGISSEQNRNPCLPAWSFLSVTKLKGFAICGALFKNERWLLQGRFIFLQQVKEIENSYPKLCLPKGRLSHRLYMLFGQLHIDFFFAVGYFALLSVYPVYGCIYKILCYILTFNKK